MKPPLDYFHYGDFSHFNEECGRIGAILTTCGKIYNIKALERTTGAYADFQKNFLSAFKGFYKDIQRISLRHSWNKSANEIALLTSKQKQCHDPYLINFNGLFNAVSKHLWPIYIGNIAVSITTFETVEFKRFSISISWNPLLPFGFLKWLQELEWLLNKLFCNRCFFCFLLEIKLEINRCLKNGYEWKWIHVRLEIIDNWKSAKNNLDNFTKRS